MLGACEPVVGASWMLDTTWTHLLRRLLGSAREHAVSAWHWGICHVHGLRGRLPRSRSCAVTDVAGNQPSTAWRSRLSGRLWASVKPPPRHRRCTGEQQPPISHCLCVGVQVPGHTCASSTSHVHVPCPRRAPWGSSPRETRPERVRAPTPRARRQRDRRPVSPSAAGMRRALPLTKAPP